MFIVKAPEMNANNKILGLFGVYFFEQTGIGDWLIINGLEFESAGSNLE
jgi:hypothetical protein